MHNFVSICSGQYHEGAFRTSVQNEKIEIVYIQPHVKEGDVVSQVIDFHAVADAIEHSFNGDEFMCEATELFRRWSGE